MIIRPAREADIDGMVDLLHTHMNSKFTRERWRRLFYYDWCPEKPDYGRVAVHEGEIVGCIAAVYSDRWIRGKRERFVNPAAWYLRKEYRRKMVAAGKGLGLSLIADLTSNDQWHYHINTSSKNTTALLRRIGFTVLDEAKYVWRAENPSSSRVRIGVIEDRDAIADTASEQERRILLDLDRFGLMPMLFEADGQTSLVIFAPSIKAAGERWLDVLYVRDPELFARWGGFVAKSVLKEADMFMAADCRFCSHAPQGAERVQLEVARYAKSRGLAAHHIDHLYSEIQLLGQKLR